MPVKAVRGFKDILPDDINQWRLVETTARDVFSTFGMKEIRTPVLERTEIFARGIGQHTDIVEKEMYTFTDRNGDSLTLRPEATAGLVRSVIEHKLYGKSPVLKLFTMGPMFRHERPQKGRLRQFHQVNVEVFGSQEPMVDVEVIWAAWEILSRLEVQDIQLQINSLGCPTCRGEHRKDLSVYMEGVFEDLCPDCKRRSKTNPLRVFDCKQEKCKELMVRAPLIKHSLCPQCSDHLGKVLDLLERIDIPFVINPYLVRGLDYYVRTTFEIVAKGLGAQSTVAAGGRYDGLVKELGGPDLPAVGMAIGVERLLLLLEESPETEKTDLFVAALGSDAREEVMPWIREWRSKGLSVQLSYEDKSLKAQMKLADKVGARYVLIVGEKEIDDEILIVRNMSTREQYEIEMDEIVEKVENMMVDARCS